VGRHEEFLGADVDTEYSTAANKGCGVYGIWWKIWSIQGKQVYIKIEARILQWLDYACGVAYDSTAMYCIARPIPPFHPEDPSPAIAPVVLVFAQSIRTHRSRPILLA
jgi:hypothetical protein